MQSMTSRAERSMTPLWEPATILPQQFAPASFHRRAPEMRLVAAILEDALQCISRNTGSPHGRRRREFIEACRWLFQDDHRDWPFTFNNICDLLGLNVVAVRERVLRAIGGRP